MADERKTDPAPDDWDSLPLDPADDDWDETPARPASADKASPPPEPAESAADEPADEVPPPGQADGPPEDDEFDAPPSFDALSGESEDDDFDSDAAAPAPAAAPEPSEALPADGLYHDNFDFGDEEPKSSETPPGEPADDDSDRGAAAAPEPSDALPAGGVYDDNFDFGDEEPKSSEAPPGGSEDDDLDSGEVSSAPAPGPFDSFLGERAGPADGAASAAPSSPDSAESLDGKGAKPDVPLPQKVELDLDGLPSPTEEDQPPEPEKPPEPPPAPKPPPQPAAPALPAAPAPAPRKKLKILALAMSALILLGGLGWLVHRLFIYAPPPPPPILVIDPTVPPLKEMEPGEMLLKPFYVNFAGEPETIVEMSVTLYYNHTPDLELIQANLPLVREVIFRLTRNRGRQVVTSGIMQRALRQELVRETNAALGTAAISYIQLTQFRILH